MKNYLSLTLLFFFFLTNVYSQFPTISWQKLYGGSFYDKGQQVIYTKDGGLAMIGFSQSSNIDVSSNRGNYDLWVVKTDFQGNIQWKKSMGGSADDEFYSIIERSDSSLIVCGSSRSADFDFNLSYGQADAWLVKFDKNGSLIWKKNYGGSGNDYARRLINTSDGGWMMIGSSESSDNWITGAKGFSDVWLMKFDANEWVQWSKNYGGTGNDFGTSVVENKNGGYTLCGFTDSNFANVTAHGLIDGYVAKLDENGGVEWQRKFGGTDNDYFRTLIETKSGKILVCGETFSTDDDASTNHGDRDYFTVMMDSLGTKQWSRCYGGSVNDYARQIIETADNQYVICGETYSNDGNSMFTHGSADFWVFKINELGDILWQKSFGGSGHDEPNGIIETPETDLIMFGQSYNIDNSGDIMGGYGDDDWWVVKLKTHADCYENLILQQPFQNESVELTAKNIIKSSSKIISPTLQISLKAEKAIELMPGFETKTGSIFKANIGGCEN